MLIINNTYTRNIESSSAIGRRRLSESGYSCGAEISS